MPPWGSSAEASTEIKEIPKTLEEAYALRDASSSREGWDFYQEHVYRLRAGAYLLRRIVTRRGVRRREVLRAGARGTGGPWPGRAGALGHLWKLLLG